jgi:prepilin-type N-terminal cleavage/methylation domain-containing protein/prepilin-type processing-associated H-X9-DG protein
MHKHPSRRAFTLIELLTTISIMAILMGLLLPSVRQARSLANRITCQSNLRQIGIGVVMFANDQNDRPPVAAPHELGGPVGRVSESDPWLPAKMFGGSLPADQRPLNQYLHGSMDIFRSPCDRGEPLWWFDTQEYQARATAFELYGSSYVYASGFNRLAGVLTPMGIAKFVGPEFSVDSLADKPLPLGQVVPLSFYQQTSKKILVGSIPIYRTMSGIVAPNPRSQWYLPDPEHLWANAGFVDGHVEFVQAFPYDAQYQGVNTSPSSANPYY